MGELFDAIRQEADKRPNSNKRDERLREFLGDAGWKDLIKAAKDSSITNAVIHRVIKNKGFPISYTAIARLRQDLAKS